MASVTIVIPCYNEAERLQVPRFQAFTCVRHRLRFLFVNDGSTDGTGKVLEALQTFDPQRFTSYELPKNMGKAEAVRQGVLRACAGDAEYVGYWDADLATPLEAIPIFCDLLEGRVMYLQCAGKSQRPAWRPSKEQKGL